MRRYALPALDPETQVLPVNGSREALFAFAQTVDRSAHGDALVVCPNPFYQIYEGAALLAGATPLFLNATACGFGDASTGRGVQLALRLLARQSRPGACMTLDDWRELFELSDRHGFVIASDECYSEIYFDEAKPPLGALQAAQQLGRDDFRRLVVFSSLSKRSNAPGMRSGFVAGDAALLKQFLLYRTYHGSAMSPPVQQRLDRGLERRSARAREPAPVRGEVSRGAALLIGLRSKTRHARRRLLPVAAHADRRHRVRPRPAAPI